MQIFKINDYLEAVCEWKKTRIAFKHEATLMLNGIDKVKVKICYQNRTRERYTYESVLEKLLDKSKAILSSDEVQQFEDAIKNGDVHERAGLKTIGLVARLGDVLHSEDAKASNDWKARTLKAGLGSAGLEMPTDWDTLDEATKTARLDACIRQLTENSIK